ncbi:MAG: helix-turn-helix domain-containing protein [Bacteroidales bacterium]
MYLLIIQISFFFFLVLGYIVLHYRTDYDYEQRVLARIVLIRSLAVLLTISASPFYHSKGVLNPAILLISPVANILLLIYIFKTIFRNRVSYWKLSLLFLPYLMIVGLWFFIQEQSDYAPPAIPNLERLLSYLSLDTVIRILLFGYVILINSFSLYLLVCIYKTIDNFSIPDKKENPLNWLRSSIVIVFLTLIMFAVRALVLNTFSMIAWFVVAIGVWFFILERAVFKYTLVMPANIMIRLKWDWRKGFRIYDAGCRLQKYEDKYMLENIIEEVDMCMSAQKPFMSSSFILVDLVGLMGNKYTKQDISDAINKYRRQTFMAYVQEYRIREAITLMETQQYSLKEIAFLTGFSSPTSFSRSFSNVHGVSPREYKKSLHFK